MTADSFDTPTTQRSTESLGGSQPPIVPSDLERALRAAPEVEARFNALPPSHKREYITWINEAKREATRVSRVQKTIAMIAGGTANPRN